jgi:EAL and modified HD-GYP domain-containing signal transduction protein
MDPVWDRFIPFVRIIKLDILDLGIDEACDYVIQQINMETNVAFLASKIETEDEFEAALDAGFRYFQGYFFGKPKIDKQKYASPEGILALQLLAEVAKKEINYKTVENLINKDMTLSYKLLRFVNTLSTRIEQPIASFHEALVYLGQDKLKIFVSLAIASYVSNNKPSELYKLSMQRAHFCQLMGEFKPFKPHARHLFLLGMFSQLDALLDSPLKPLVDEMPLSEEVKKALASREGELGLLLRLEESYEYADWDEIDNLCQQLDLPFSEVTRALCKAQFWENNLV